MEIKILKFCTETNEYKVFWKRILLRQVKNTIQRTASTIGTLNRVTAPQAFDFVFILEPIFLQNKATGL